MENTETTNEVVEIVEEYNETEKFYNDPIAATSELQKKYLGITYEEYKRNESYEGEAKEGFEIKTQELYDPFKKESYKINVLVEKIQETTPEEINNLIISDKIRDLKIKVANGTATTEEKEDLKLLLL